MYFGFPLSLGSSKDFVLGPNGGMKERDGGEKVGWAQACLPSSKLQNTFFKLGGKNTGQFLWHQHTFFQDMIYMFGPHFK